MLAAAISALHVLSLGVGLGAIVARTLALRRLARGEGALAAVFTADNFWGAAALFWIGTGVVRLFGGTDKGVDFYLYNGLFWVKMGLLATVLALEVWPMVTLVRWRIAAVKGQTPDTSRAGTFAWLSNVEAAIVVLMPFVAAGMARGLWLLP